MRRKTNMKHILVIASFVTSMSAFATVAPKVVYQNGSPTYSIEWKNSVAKITDLVPEIKVNGKWIKATDFKEIRWEKRASERLSEKNRYDSPVEMLYLTCTGHPSIENFTVAFELMADRPYLVMNSTLTPSKEITLGGIRVFNSNEANIKLPGNSKDWMIFNENAAAPHTPAILYPYQLNTPKAKEGKFSKAHTGVWLSMLVNESKNYAFSFASIAAELWPNNFRWELPVQGDNNSLKLTARSGAIFEREQIIVAPGKTIVSDPFMVSFRDEIRPTQALYETGVVMGENVRKGKPMRKPAAGWSSWHSYERTVTEKSVLTAADFIKDNLSEYGWTNIQIDGGWWTEQGLYKVNDDFGSGIRSISNYVTDKGLDFGLHISPLRINMKDPALKNHPEWALKPFKEQKIDKNDDEMVTTLGTEYVDASCPGVPQFLAGRYQQMVEGYRPTFMKWDHHYGALEEGKRNDPSMTSLQAHNQAVREIRGALPEDLIVTRSMGYLFGALECYDAIRVGNDINHPGVKSASEPWANMTYGKTLGTIDDDQVQKGLIRFARQAARNFFIHKNIAISDPDAFFVSPSYTLNEAKCHMTLQAIMGGLFFFGDRVESLPEERLALLKNRDIIEVNHIGEYAVPLDLFSGVDIPRVWKIETKDRLIITVFNWMDDASEKSFDFKKDFELNSKKYNLKELWTGDVKRVSNGKLTLAMEPHSVKIFEFQKGN
ncbi:MAG: alpha-galactosidase [Bacteroidales bacterium]